MNNSNHFVEFKVEGAKELDKVLADLPKSMTKTLIKQALRRAAKPIVNDARAMAPKRTGAMAKSIKAHTMVKTNVPSIAIGPDSEHWYGILQELGTSRHPAQPFLRPAWEKNKAQVSKSLVNSLLYVLNRKAEKLKKQAYSGKLSQAARKALGL